jgi:hypothetical protein
MAAGEYYKYFYFTPNHSGTGGNGTISYTAPPGSGVQLNNGSPYLQTISLTITATPMSFVWGTNYNGLFVVGKDLQYQNYIALGGPAPAGGLVVRVTSSDSGKVLVSGSPTAQGAGYLDLTIAEGQTNSAWFYIQSLVASGTVTLTTSVVTSPNPGFAPGNPLAVTLFPAGYMLFCAGTGCSGPTNGVYVLNTTTQATNTLLYMQVTAIDPDRTDNNYFSNEYMTIRGGYSQNIPLSVNAAFGGFRDYGNQNTVINSVSMANGDYYTYFYFSPNHSGSGGTGSISFTKPADAWIVRSNNMDYLQSIYLTITQ